MGGGGGGIFLSLFFFWGGGGLSLKDFRTSFWYWMNKTLYYNNLSCSKKNLKMLLSDIFQIQIFVSLKDKLVKLQKLLRKKNWNKIIIGISVLIVFFFNLLWIK